MKQKQNKLQKFSKTKPKKRHSAFFVGRKISLPCGRISFLHDFAVAKSLAFHLTVVYTSVMKTVLNVKVDSYVKSQAQILSKSLGLPLSIVVNDSLRNFVDNQQITFSRFTPNKKFEARLKKIQLDTELGRNISPVFSSMNEAIKYLHSKSK